MKLSFLLLVVGALALGQPVSNAADSKLKSGDEAFVKKAAQGGMMEVKLGEIASTKGKRADVKAFGAQMVTDHGKANAELKALAAQKGVSLPETLDNKHSETVEKISKLEGDEFDGAYVKEMVKDHEKDVKDFEKAASSAADPEVKAFAAKTLPTLKTHLEHVKGLLGEEVGSAPAEAWRHMETATRPPAD